MALLSPKDEGNRGKPTPPGQDKKNSPEADAIDRLRETVTAMFEWFKSHADFATKQDLKEMESRLIMTYKEGFQQVVASLGTFATGVETSVAEVATAVEGITTDIKTLNDKITEIQNSTGPLSDADQAALDAAQAAGTAAVTKLQAASTALKALDELTPAPTPTPTP